MSSGRLPPLCHSCCGNPCWRRGPACLARPPLLPHRLPLSTAAITSSAMRLFFLLASFVCRGVPPPAHGAVWAVRLHRSPGSRFVPESTSWRTFQARVCSSCCSLRAATRTAMSDAETASRACWVPSSGVSPGLISADARLSPSKAPVGSSRMPMRVQCELHGIRCSWHPRARAARAQRRSLARSQPAKRVEIGRAHV